MRDGGWGKGESDCASYEVFEHILEDGGGCVRFFEAWGEGCVPGGGEQGAEVGRAASEDLRGDGERLLVGDEN